MPDLQHKTVLGFDFGMRRIGVAIGQTVTHSATALEKLTAKDGIPDWNLVQSLIETWEVDGIIVGLPLNMDGSEQALTQNVKKFGNRLKEKFKLPVYFVDERLTTIEARQQLYDQGTSGKNIQHVDSYAAKLITESWLRQAEENSHET